MGKGKLIDEIFGECCEHQLIATFIMDYPIEMSPLAKKHRSREGVVERFRGHLNGKRSAMPFLSSTIPSIKESVSKHSLNLGRRGDQESMVLERIFSGPGVRDASTADWVLNRQAGHDHDEQSSIQDVLFFPQMRPEKRGLRMVMKFSLAPECLRTGSLFCGKRGYKPWLSFRNRMKTNWQGSLMDCGRSSSWKCLRYNLLIFSSGKP
jgi:hypothetical protein